MTTLPFWQRWSVQTVAALAAALAVTFITYGLELAPTLRTSVAVAVSSWTIVMVFYIAYSLHSLHLESLAARAVREAIDASDCLLLELQSRLREIAARPLNGRPNHVFIDYCHRSLKATLDVAICAAQSGELTVRDHHFDTVDKVMEAFEGCDDRTFRCVWLLEDGVLFDDSWRQYMRCLVELGRKSRRTQKIQVRILFVAEDLDGTPALQRPAVRTLLGFVSNATGFEARLITKDAYEGYLRDAALSNEYLDFGVYGDHLLFRTTQYDPTNEGIFSINATAIQKYRRVHDLAMNAAHAGNLPLNLPRDVSLEAFLHCDTCETDSGAPSPRRVER